MWFFLAAAGAGYLAQRWQNTHKVQFLTSASAEAAQSGCVQNESKGLDPAVPPTPCNTLVSTKSVACNSDDMRELTLEDVDSKIFSTTSTDVPASPYVVGTAGESFEIQEDNEASSIPSEDKFTSFEVKTKEGNPNEMIPIPGVDLFRSINFSSQNRGFPYTDDDYEGFTSPTKYNSELYKSLLGRTRYVQKFSSTPFQEEKQKKDMSYQGEDFFGSSQSESEFNDFQEWNLNYSQSLYHRGLFQEINSPCNTSPSKRFDYDGGSLSSSLSELVLGINVPQSEFQRLGSETNASFSRRERTQNECSGSNRLKLITENLNDKGYMKAERAEQFMEGSVVYESPCESDKEMMPSPSFEEDNHESEYESLVGFRLSIALLFMASTTRREMEKMGTMLKKTEDLVSDMRKELDERKACSHNELLCVGYGSPIDNQDIFSEQESNMVNTNFSVDICCVDDLGDDNESALSVITEDSVTRIHVISDLEAKKEAELKLLSSNVDGSFSPSKHLRAGQFNEGCGFAFNEMSSKVEEDYNTSDIQLERQRWKSAQKKLEERIVELEDTLESALMELHMKDLEIAWWKDRVNWLMEHPEVG